MKDEIVERGYYSVYLDKYGEIYKEGLFNRSTENSDGRLDSEITAINPNLICTKEDLLVARGLLVGIGKCLEVEGVTWSLAGALPHRLSHEIRIAKTYSNGGESYFVPAVQYVTIVAVRWYGTNVMKLIESNRLWL